MASRFTEPGGTQPESGVIPTEQLNPEQDAQAIYDKFITIHTNMDRFLGTIRSSYDNNRGVTVALERFQEELTKARGLLDDLRGLSAKTEVATAELKEQSEMYNQLSLLYGKCVSQLEGVVISVQSGEKIDYGNRAHLYEVSTMIVSNWDDHSSEGINWIEDSKALVRTSTLEHDLPEWQLVAIADWQTNVLRDQAVTKDPKTVAFSEMGELLIDTFNGVADDPEQVRQTSDQILPMLWARATSTSTGDQFRLQAVEQLSHTLATVSEAWQEQYPAVAEFYLALRANVEKLTEFGQTVNLIEQGSEDHSAAS